jgi:hypothetical protein
LKGRGASDIEPYKNFIRLLKTTDIAKFDLEHLPTEWDEYIIANVLVDFDYFDIIRVNNEELIATEIKAKYAVKSDYLKHDDCKIHPTKNEVVKYCTLSKNGIKCSIIVAIALPDLCMIEIPFEKFIIPNLEDKPDDKILLRIPLGYRDTSEYIKIPTKFYNYSDQESLIREVKKFGRRFDKYYNGLMHYRLKY